MKVANRVVSILIITMNLYFFPYTIIIIKNIEGPIEYGYSIIPITISINILLITAVLTFNHRFSESLLLLVINGLGLIWVLFVLWLLLTVPLMD